MATTGGERWRLDATAIDRIARQAFGSSARVRAAEILAGGQTNDTRMVSLADGQRLVLRVAPSEAIAAKGPSWFTAFGLRREAVVIAAASELAPLLPVTIAHDFDSIVVDHDWVFQAVMPGQPLAVLDPLVDAEDRKELWRQFGAFVRRLHEVTGSRFGTPAWGPAFDRWSDLLAWDADGFISDAARFDLAPGPFGRLREAIGRLASSLDERTVPRLVHSDLWPSHVFATVTANGYRLAGVIDFEFGHFADALSEHLLASFAWGDVPTAMEPAFREGYGLFQAPPDAELRNQIYLARGFGWEITLRASQGRDTGALMRELVAILDTLDRS